MNARENFSLKSLAYGWWIWLMAAVFYALDYFQHTAPSVLLKPIAHASHMSFFAVGDIMSLYFPIYAISQIPAGYLLDRFGIRRVLPLACLTVSVGLFLMSHPDKTLLIDGRILIAIGSAFAFLGALETASLALPKRLFPLAVGLTNTIGVLGGILGQVLLNYIVVSKNWIDSLHFIAWFGVALSGFLILFLRPPRKKEVKISEQKKPEKTRYFQIFKDVQIWILALYGGIMVGTVVNAFSELYDVKFLESVFHFSSQYASEVSGMIFIGIAVGGPSHGLITSFFRSEKTWPITGCIATIAMFALIAISSLFTTSSYLILILYFLTGFFVSSMLLVFSLAKRSYPSSVHASIFGIANMTIGVCGFIFQVILGWMLEHFLKVFAPAHSNYAYLVSFLVLLAPLAVALWLIVSFKIDKSEAQVLATHK